MTSLDNSLQVNETTGYLSLEMIFGLCNLVAVCVRIVSLGERGAAFKCSLFLHRHQQISISKSFQNKSNESASHACIHAVCRKREYSRMRKVKKKKRSVVMSRVRCHLLLICELHMDAQALAKYAVILQITVLLLLELQTQQAFVL